MYSTKTPFIAIALSCLVLLGAASITEATPGQKGKKKPAAGASSAPTKAQIDAGKKIYDANGCGACHMVGDKGGKLGPELSHIGSDKKWPAARLVAVVRDPKKTLKTEKMPAYGADKINEKELKSLVTYLGSLK